MLHVKRKQTQRTAEAGEVVSLWAVGLVLEKLVPLAYFHFLAFDRNKYAGNMSLSSSLWFQKNNNRNKTKQQFPFSLLGRMVAAGPWWLKGPCTIFRGPGPADCSNKELWIVMPDVPIFKKKLNKKKIFIFKNVLSWQHIYIFSNVNTLRLTVSASSAYNFRLDPALRPQVCSLCRASNSISIWGKVRAEHPQQKNCNCNTTFLLLH